MEIEIILIYDKWIIYEEYEFLILFSTLQINLIISNEVSSAFYIHLWYLPLIFVLNYI